MNKKIKVHVHYTDWSLQKVGVKIIDKDRVLLKCDSCRQIWSPTILAGGKLPVGWWKCPNKCNE